MDMTADQMKEFQRAFKMLDRDGEGNIQARDLGAFMRDLGKMPTDSELQSMVNQVDTDGNGTIDFEEFASAMMARMKQVPDDDDLREAFNVYDKEGTGIVGPDQLRSVMIALRLKPTFEEIDELIQEGDEDGDGFLSYEEFVRLMTPQ
ncbi:calmodulin-beta-like [Drosophila montana]|uniref:calmodulin-beta-like n=1 Tax=Drosophila montana TaxID=40370 RepID=UPI00313BB766